MTDAPNTRVYDAHTVAQTILADLNADAHSILEQLVADRISCGMCEGTDDIVSETVTGYDFDDCGNRRMRVEAYDAKTQTIAIIDITDIVDTILDLTQNIYAARLKDLATRYDLFHHCGIYADEVEA